MHKKCAFHCILLQYISRYNYIHTFWSLNVADIGIGCSSVGPTSPMKWLHALIQASLRSLYFLTAGKLWNFTVLSFSNFNRSGYRESLLQVPQAHLLTILLWSFHNIWFGHVCLSETNVFPKFRVWLHHGRSLRVTSICRVSGQLRFFVISS